MRWFAGGNCCGLYGQLFVTDYHPLTRQVGSWFTYAQLPGLKWACELPVGGRSRTADMD